MGAPDGAAAGTIAARPLLRGVSHQVAFVASLVAGAALVANAQTSRATVAAVVFAATVAGMFGASALYHRVHWGPRAKRWMRRVDHAGDSGDARRIASIQHGAVAQNQVVEKRGTGRLCAELGL